METSAPLNHLVQTAAGGEKRQRSPRENLTPPRENLTSFRENLAPHSSTGGRSAGANAPYSARPPLVRSDEAGLGERDRGAGYRPQGGKTPPAPPPPPPLQEGGGSLEDSGGLKKQVQVFRRHSQRLSEVASVAAQRTKDTRRELVATEHLYSKPSNQQFSLSHTHQRQVLYAPTDSLISTQRNIILVS